MDYDPCCGCGTIATQSCVPCVVCDTALFCSDSCVWDNFSHHADDCATLEAAQDELDHRIHSTPRSVFDRVVFQRIEHDVVLQTRLLRLFQLSELCYGKGALVLECSDAEEMCTLMNRAVDPNKIIEQLTRFQTCTTLMKTHEKAQSVCSARIRMMESTHTPPYNHQFVYCVFCATLEGVHTTTTTTTTTIRTRLFSVHPAAAAAPPLPLSVSETLGL
jgi:hypothetical protein